MSTATTGTADRSATVEWPHYIDGLIDSSNDIHQHRRYFSYRTAQGLMAGTATSVTFTLDRGTKEVWPLFRDFNLWQNSYHHYYSGVVGDLEGRTIELLVGSNQDDPDRPSAEYNVVRVIPQYVIVMSQIPKAQRWREHGTVEGIGGFMVFMLSEQAGKTLVTILMQHEQLAGNKSEAEALGFWQKTAPENLMKWRDYFVPTLRRLVRELGSPDREA